MLRRGFVQLLGGLLLGTVTRFTSGARASEPEPGLRFAHGVASGDPLADRVILWTRISGTADGAVTVTWTVARDAGLTDVVAAGQTGTGPERDYTVKVDATGLPAGATLYYGFSAAGVRSPVGRTRTLPQGDPALARFAVVSCSNYAAGYFNVYREIAARDDLDAVIHLGDTIYEHGQGGYATEMAERLGRVPQPLSETVTLADYRQRHAQYKSDPDSVAMLSRHPLIAVWDDHEIANDAWRGGAGNHDDGEGPWQARRLAGMRAFFEWMPVRGEPAGRDTAIFRYFDYGKLLRLIMLDTRHYGRDRQPDVSGTDGSREAVLAVVDDGKREMLGRRQRRWLRRRLRGAGTTWQILGQQVLVSPLEAPDLEPVLDLGKRSYLSRDQLRALIARSKSHPPELLDVWDGYPWARRRLLADLGRFGTNAVVLSGDLHTPIAGDLLTEDGNEVVAVEFMPSSVTSPGFADYLPEREPGLLSAAVMAQNPGIRYMDTSRRGWLCLTVTHEECLGEWHHVDTVFSQEYTSAVERRLRVRAGQVDKGLEDA